MRDLAPEITRQRLLLEGHFTITVDEASLRRFLIDLPAALGLHTYGDPTVFASAGLGRDQNQGYDAFIPLIDSGISLYVWSAARFLSLIVFTCREFDTEAAVSFTRDWFSLSDVAHQTF
ncbi:MAG: S-adenosylmethionine decarboxylase [Acidimicrobiia bacterium]